MVVERPSTVARTASRRICTARIALYRCMFIYLSTVSWNGKEPILPAPRMVSLTVFMPSVTVVRNAPIVNTSHKAD